MQRSQRDVGAKGGPMLLCIEAQLSHLLLLLLYLVVEAGSDEAGELQHGAAPFC